MKTCFKLLAIIAAISIPCVLMAQKTDPGFVQFSPGTAFKEKAAQDFKLLPQPSAVNGLKSSFMHHLPSTIPGENRKFFLDHPQTDPVYYYNMPLVKPGKTSKILIAELDADFPYSYKMPIKKNEAIEMN